MNTSTSCLVCDSTAIWKLSISEVSGRVLPLPAVSASRLTETSRSAGVPGTGARVTHDCLMQRLPTRPSARCVNCRLLNKARYTPMAEKHRRAGLVPARRLQSFDRRHDPPTSSVRRTSAGATCRVNPIVVIPKATTIQQREPLRVPASKQHRGAYFDHRTHSHADRIVRDHPAVGRLRHQVPQQYLYLCEQQKVCRTISWTSRTVTRAGSLQAR